MSVGWCSSPFQGSEPAVRHSSATRVVGHTSSMYCRYLPGSEAGTKLYCLVTEAHVCEQIAQGHVTWQCTGWDLNLQPPGYKFEMLPLQYQANAVVLAP